MSLLGILASGDIVGAIKKLWALIFGTPMPDNLANFVAKAATAEGQILESLVNVGIKDVEANGFTTASFVTAGKDILAQLIAQNITTFTLQNVMAMLNIAAAPLLPATSVTPPVVAGT